MKTPPLKQKRSKMKRFILTLLIPTLIAIHANAQSITEDDLTQIRESFTQDASTGAIQNILMG